MTVSDKELEQAREYYAGWRRLRDLIVAGADEETIMMAFATDYRAEGERAVFEKACKAVCDACAAGDPIRLVARDEWQYHSTLYCPASPIRAALPHLAKPEEL